MSKTKFTKVAVSERLLTGKAKEDFLNFYWENYIGKTRCISTKEESEDFFNSLIKPLKPALIMEWLDSVGIFIFPKRLTMSFEFKEWYFIITNSSGAHLNNHVSKESRILNDSREEIMSIAIQKANEIYNSNYGNP